MRKVRLPAEPVVDEVRRIRAEMWRSMDCKAFNEWFDARFPAGSFKQSPLRPKRAATKRRSK